MAASLSVVFAIPGGEFFINVRPVADRYETNDTRFAIDFVDDTIAANTKLPQPVELAEERHSTFWVGGNGTNRRFDSSFQIWMERTDNLGNMGRDVWTERIHAERRFLMGDSGSPKTSSKERPVLRLR